MKRTILQYHTGTLYNQKHAVCFKRSSNPLCPLTGCHQLDSTLHMLSGCQNNVISSMKTKRHNVAGRVIIKALSKSPGGCLNLMSWNCLMQLPCTLLFASTC
eukprot:695638-Pelagomonas_calceolata.AAC.1